MSKTRANVKTERGETATLGNRLWWLVEPVMIGFLGITIGSIVIAMYLPLFSLIGKLSSPGS